MIGRDTVVQLRHLLRPLQVRLANVIARAVVQLVSDSGNLQRVQLGVLPGEDLDDAEHFQPYGFSSVPRVGAEAVVIFPNGDRGHPLVVAISDRRYRPTGKPAGEVAVYSDEGDEVRLARGHVVVITTSGAVKLGGASLGLPADGVVLGSGVDTFTGATYAALGSASTKVFAKKV